MNRIIFCAILITFLTTGLVSELAAQGSGTSSRSKSPAEKKSDQNRREVGKVTSQVLSFENVPENENRPRRGRTRGQAVRLGVPQTTTSKDGVITTEVEEKKRAIKIEERPDGSVRVLVTRHYDANEMDVVKRKHPELADYIELFPTQVDNHKIAFSLSIQSEYAAGSLAQLKRLHPSAAGIYRRFHNKNR